jgi:NitT/TauT family transport system substrate-binding protein
LNQIRLNRYILLILVTISLLLSACTAAETPAANQPTKLRFAALRILDSLPLYVAESQGYFQEAGLAVEIIPVGSAPERDQLIAAGQADGMINELMSTLFANRDTISTQIVRIARAANSQNPVFRILASQKSGINDLTGLQEVEIGISEGTIIEYVTDRLLEAEGYATADFPKVNIPAIPDRLALINSGELSAAVLPDPAASLAMQGGAIVVIDDASHPEYGYSTIAFRKDYLDSQSQAVKSFLVALEKAVKDINQDPQKWSSILVDQQIVPAPLAGTYSISSFPTASIPSEAQFNDAVEWAKSKGLLDSNPEYQNTVISGYLP